MGIPHIDYHIHTVYSGHSASDMTVRNIVERAELIGLKSIVILEHAFYPSMGRTCLEQIKKELDAIESEVDVLVGMEIDPDYTKKGKLIFEDFERDGLDVILVGTHTIPGTDKGWCAEMKLTQEEKERIYYNWFETIYTVLEERSIDIIAHPGRLISRNGIIENFSGNVLKDFEYLFSVAKKKNVAIELNESFLRILQSENRLEPYMEVIRLALSGGLKISIGSDAHSPDRIGEKNLSSQIIKHLKIPETDIFFRQGRIHGKKDIYSDL